MVRKPLTEHHVISFSTYILIWISLVGLTAITVSIAGINLGGFTLVAALLIAAAKSALVINIFMHIRFDDPLFKVFIILAIMTLVAVFSLTAFDIFTI